MQFTLDDGVERTWTVEKIGVIGPGIVGMPMAALLADASIKIGSQKAARVHVIQRNSISSGWKVDAINQGRSVIGGIEPGLDSIVREAVDNNLLSAGFDYSELADADVVLVAIQTDKAGFEPDYGPLFGGLKELAVALQDKPANKIPVIIFESTLAPSSMSTVIKDLFHSYGLIEGRDILLGNSPNRVMPGRLVERVTVSDKLVAGLHKATPTLISHLYRNIVTKGNLFQTNSMTAEVVKTLENAYRDVRIAFSSEIAAYCDFNDIDFYAVREEVNNRLGQTDNACKDPNCVPSGGMLIPMIGVGGHCLPKDGILLQWRQITTQPQPANSMILNARQINDGAPGNAIRLMEKEFGTINGKKVTILGTAYRFNSEDTRNSPSIQMALQLLEKGCAVTLHDNYVKETDQNLLRYEVDSIFTRDLEKAVNTADCLVFATAHQEYFNNSDFFLKHSGGKCIFDGCNIFQRNLFEEDGVAYTGIGRGRKGPTEEFLSFVHQSFLHMETGFANELQDTVDFLNKKYAHDQFNEVDFGDVQRLAASCSTGCVIADTGPDISPPQYQGFSLKLFDLPH